MSTKDEQKQRCVNALIAELLETAEQCQALATQLDYRELTPEIAAIWYSDAMIERVHRIIELGFGRAELVYLCEEYGGFGGSDEDQRNFFEIVNELRKVFA